MLGPQIPSGAEYNPPQYGGNAPAGEAPRKPKRPSDFARHFDYPIALWTQWDIPSVQNALDAHTLGNFSSSGLLAEAMTQDDAFDAVLNTRVLGLISRAFSITTSKLGNKTKARIAQQVIAERWDQIAPEETVASILRWSLQVGFALAQIVWRYEDKMWLPRLEVWHPSLVYYRLDTRTYVVNTMEGQVNVIPGTGQWFLFTPYGPYRGWMQGAVRSISIPWMARQYALRDWARYGEVHGLPIKVLKVPAEAQGDDKAAVFATFANLGNESAIMLPQGLEGNPALGYDMDLVEATANTWQGFEALITKCETRMAIRMLGQNLTTEVDAGSLAAANVHDRVRLDYTRWDAKGFATSLREQLLVPFCAFNYGAEEIAGSPKWNTEPPEDKATKAAALTSIAAAVQALVTAGAPVDVRALLEKEGIPTLPRGEDPDVLPELVLPPPGGDSGAPGGAPAPPPKPPVPPPEGATPAARARLSAMATVNASAVSGQLYIDSVADKAKAGAAKALRPHVARVASDVRSAADYEDLRARLKATLAGASPARMAKIVEKTIVLSDLAGRHSVKKDLR